MSTQPPHGMAPPDFSKPPPMMMNMGNPSGGFPAPPMHNSCNRQPFHQPRFGPPCFSQPPPWGPRPERNNFNHGQFMRPPHNLQRPVYTPDNIFGAANSSSMSGKDNFPYSGQQNNFNTNGPPFQGLPNQRRGGSFMRGNRGGQRGGGGGGFHGQPFRGQQERSGQDKKKKEKIDKRDLPENNVFFCDICDRGFKTEEKYKEHTDGHIQCSYKDCPFIAAPKLVQLHMNMQHRSGLAKKVWNLESEEDVMKWREDRKRNFPTAENIAKKKQQQAEKLARGELLNTKDFSKMRGGKNRDRGRGGRGRGRERKGRGGKWKDYDRVRSEEMQAEQHDDEGSPEEVGIQHCDTRKGTSDSEINGPTPPSTSSTESIKESESLQEESATATNVSGLGLLSSYGFSSSSEDEEESPPEAPKKPEPNRIETLVGQGLSLSPKSSVSLSPKLKCDLLPNPEELLKSVNTSNGNKAVVTPLIPIKETETGHAKIKEVKPDSPDNTSPNVTGDNHNQKKNHKGSPQAGGSKREHNFVQSGGPPNKKSRAKSHAAPPRKYTLLEKLLAPDIRRERNKILQCVHYIVKNKFFDTSGQENVQMTPMEL